MEREIARLGERITFQKNSVVADKYGNHKNAWEDYFTCHAYVSTWQKEETEGATTNEERSVTFEVRYCSELSDITSDKFQVLFRGEAYNILSVDMMNYGKRTSRLKAERVLRKVTP